MSHRSRGCNRQYHKAKCRSKRVQKAQLDGKATSRQQAVGQRRRGKILLEAADALGGIKVEQSDGGASFYRKADHKGVFVDLFRWDGDNQAVLQEVGICRSARMEDR